MNVPFHIVGLTGGIGSGKSTVVRMFGDLGVHWVDADDVSRQVVEPGMPALTEIRDHFGPQVVTETGALDRAWLRQKIFEDPAEKGWLEGLLHPMIREELVRQLSQPPSPYTLPYVLLVSPLLLETDQHKLVDRVLVVDVPESVQMERTMARDDNSREQVERIMAAQMPRTERTARASAIINNNCPLPEVERQVRDLHDQLLAEFG